MRGIELYSMWEEVNRDRGCNIDQWEELDAEEKDMWDELASKATPVGRALIK